MDLVSIDLAAPPVARAASPVGERAPRVRVPLDRARLARAKAAYTTRFVSRLLATDTSGYDLLTGPGVAPRPGDVVLARVEALGQHRMIEQPDGRRATLYPGDEILVAYGHRYAPDQFEAEVPADLGPADLVAAGGVASRTLSAHSKMSSPTRVAPLGLLADAGGVVTLDRCAPYSALVPSVPSVPSAASNGLRAAAGRPTVIGVVGTSMNSGKSTTAASIVRGLTAAGHRVAAGKITGTGAGGDPGMFTDAGAVRVLDFTDFGHASTYLLPHEHVAALLDAIVGELAAPGPDVVVVEVADGLFQSETARLTADPAFTAATDHVVFAATDALGAVAGRSVLSSRGVAVSAISGILTASPLAMRETRAAITDVPVLSVADLSSPQVATLLGPGTAAAGTGVRSADALAAS